jgi:hypothetical protein
MKYTALLTFIVLLMTSCSIKNNFENYKYELLKSITNEYFKLQDSELILEESNDTIRINEIRLIPFTESNFYFDSTKNELFLYLFHCPTLNNNYFKDSLNFILEQIPNIETTYWDSAFLMNQIKIVNIDTVKSINKKENIYLWIAHQKSQISFLMITEPLININGQVLISSNLYANPYVISKYLIFEKTKNHWQSIDSLTVISKQKIEYFNKMTRLAIEDIDFYDL